ncbi:MAG: hypothetical protein ACFHX7_19410 [Pseudomonadota bacterium]
MIERLGRLDSPSTALAAARAGRTVYCWFEHKPDYQGGAPTQAVAALLAPVAGEVIALLARKELLDAALDRVAPDRVASDRVTSDSQLDPTYLQALAEAAGTRLLFLDQPLALSTVTIAKPWGEEIWYTGIEARGVCRVCDTPLPWYLELVGNEFSGSDITAPLLLKILAPRPEESYGELYFEMHNQKVEVYVVTHVDETAWPNGTGGIRYGFNQALIDSFENLNAFQQSYLAAVRDYRAARLTLDNELDRIKAAAGIDPQAVIDTATLEGYKALVDPAIVAQEARVRDRLNRYSTVYPVSRGDVIRVPPFTPHSLQHGVRVVEFQTPHYERFILSFSQKVLTQDHWDTEVALPQANFAARFDTSLEATTSTEGCLVETVADFAEFNVVRITLAPGADHTINLDSYAIVMCIDGEPTVNGASLHPEQAVLLPHSHASLHLQSGATGSRQTGSRQTGSRQTGSRQTGSRQTGSRQTGSRLLVARPRSR